MYNICFIYNIQAFLYSLDIFYYFTSKSSRLPGESALTSSSISGVPNVLPSISPVSSTVGRSSSSLVSGAPSVVFGSSMSTSCTIVVPSSTPSVVSSSGLMSTVRTLKMTCPKLLCWTWTVSLMMNLWSPTICAEIWNFNHVTQCWIKSRKCESFVP